MGENSRFRPDPEMRGSKRSQSFQARPRNARLEAKLSMGNMKLPEAIIQKKQAQESTQATQVRSPLIFSACAGRAPTPIASSRSAWAGGMVEFLVKGLKTLQRV